MYKLRFGNYPTTDKGFEILIESKILKEHPLDGFGNPLHYINISEQTIPFLVYSSSSPKEMSAFKKLVAEFSFTLLPTLLFVSFALNVYFFSRRSNGNTNNNA